MLQVLRERLTIVLLALLPLHALLVTFGTKLLRGPMQAPLPQLALWKEVALGIILLIAFVEILSRLRDKDERKKILRLYIYDWLIVAMIALGGLVTYMTHADLQMFAFGFKYDFVPLVAFFILKRVVWYDAFRTQAENVLITIGVLVSLYGLVSLALPRWFFLFLGYNDMHSLYIPTGPISAFQQIGAMGIQRMQSTMSGPNQLGLWLLIPLTFSLLRVVHCDLGTDGWAKKILSSFSTSSGRRRCFSVFACIVLLTAIFFTFSRSAWIASGVITFVILVRHASIKKFRKSLIRLSALIFFLIALSAFLFPEVILRLPSTQEHFLRPAEAWNVIKQKPFGIGLGTAGPASNRLSDACVYLPADGDASWAQGKDDLCVFLGKEQVLPIDRTCFCPFLPENWYLQLGVEMGILGMALFISLLFFIVRKLISIADDNVVAECLYLSILGISIAALFLHAWEDSVLAYTIWILLAAAMVSPKKKEEE